MRDERNEDDGSFASLDALKKRAAETLERAARAKDWDEAFRAHPRIGEKKAEGAAERASRRRWCAKEQAKRRRRSAGDAGRAPRRRTAPTRRSSRRIYIVCATGKTAEEMLAIAKERMENDPDTSSAAPPKSSARSRICGSKSWCYG